jgi:hypothetical protein
VSTNRVLFVLYNAIKIRSHFWCSLTALNIIYYFHGCSKFRKACTRSTIS